MVACTSAKLSNLLSEMIERLPRSPSDFGRHIAAETEKWGKVVRAANIRAD
jgi:hypothetical protein